MKSNRLEQQWPPLGEVVEIDGLGVHYTDSGPADAGAAIVLIHGASTSLRDFHVSLVGPLSAAHRVIAVDRPGHGFSGRPAGDWPDPAEQAALMHALLLRLGVTEPVLVGHSWAGSLVLAYLLDRPGTGRGGVLLAGGSHPWEGGVAWYNAVAGVPLLGELFAWTMPMTLGRLRVGAGVRSVFAPQAPMED